MVATSRAGTAAKYSAVARRTSWSGSRSSPRSTGSTAACQGPARAAKQDDGAAAHRFAGISAGNLGQRTRQGVRKRRSEPAPAEEGLKPVLVFHPQRREEHRPSGLVAQGEERPEGLPLHVRVFVAEGLA